MSFPSTHPSLLRLDASTECPICKSTPFVGPVSIACGHSFCSRCIRDALDGVTNVAERRCPVCGEQAKESEIRRNRSLEEISEAWVDARALILSLVTQRSQQAKRKVPPSSRPPLPHHGSTSSSSSVKPPDVALAPSQKRRRLSNGLDSPAAGGLGKNRHVSEDHPEVAEGSRSGMPRRHSDVVSLDGSSDVEGFDEDRRADGDDHRVLEDADQIAVDDEEDAIEIMGEGVDDPDRLVDCPICSAQVPLAQIDPHIARGCPPPLKTSRKTQAKGWNAIFSGTGTGNGPGPTSFSSGSAQREDAELWSKRIRKPNWNLANEKELRGILGSYGLPADGDKSVLGERLRLWISIFNANLDTDRPRNKSGLRAELIKQEKAVQKDKEEVSRAKKAYKEIGPGSKEGDEVFRKMIADVRARQAVKKAQEG